MCLDEADPILDEKLFENLSGFLVKFEDWEFFCNYMGLDNNL